MILPYKSLIKFEKFSEENFENTYIDRFEYKIYIFNFFYKIQNSNITFSNYNSLNFYFFFLNFKKKNFFYFFINYFMEIPKIAIIMYKNIINIKSKPLYEFIIEQFGKEFSDNRIIKISGV